MIKYNNNIPQSARDLIDIILQNQKFKHHVIKAESSALGVRGEMKANIKSKDDVKSWLDTFETSTNTTFRVNYTKPSAGVWIIYKLGVKCHQNTGGKKLNSDENRSCKNTKCPARITFTVNSIPTKVYKRNCYVDPELPTVIDFYYEHNHPINSADVLRFRPVDSSVEEKLMGLYQKGHSPISALQVIKIDLENEHPNDFETFVTDRKYCPDLSFCHRLFYKKFKNSHREIKQEFLAEKVREYNQMCNMTCAKISESPNDFVLTVCTPLMFRIHQNVSQAAEIMFVDATGCVKEKDKTKENGHRMFLLSTYNEAGCLPLGVIITMSDSPDVIYKGLELYKTLFPTEETCFYGRGRTGPEVIMTEDTVAERVALDMSWRASKLLLCTFHVLQSMWRWLMKSKHCIKKEDRPMLFETFKSVVYASTEAKCKESFEKLKRLAKEYTMYSNHVSSLWERRTEWALCYRSPSTLVIRENSFNQNQNIQNVTKILKDEIFERVKSFNLIQLADFIFTRFETYYCRKLLNVAYNRVVQKKFRDQKPCWKSPSDAVLKSIKELDIGVFTVPSESDAETLHTVDMQLMCCTCSIGRHGFVCKHQYWVSLIIDKTREEKSLEFRKHSYYLAKGEQANDMWLLHNSSATLPTQQNSNDSGASVINSIARSQLWSEGLKIIEEKLSFDNNAVDHLLTQFIENLKNLPQNSHEVHKAFQNFAQSRNDNVDSISNKETESADTVDRPRRRRAVKNAEDKIQKVPGKRKRKEKEVNQDQECVKLDQKDVNILSHQPENESAEKSESLSTSTNDISLKNTTTFPNYYDSNSLNNDSKIMYNISTEP